MRESLPGFSRVFDVPSGRYEPQGGFECPIMYSFSCAPARGGNLLIESGVDEHVSAGFRAGSSALELGEFEVELVSVPPGDGGVGGEGGFAEDG
jgi:hypothetical protein